MAHLWAVPGQKGGQDARVQAPLGRLDAGSLICRTTQLDTAASWHSLTMWMDIASCKARDAQTCCTARSDGNGDVTLADRYLPGRL